MKNRRNYLLIGIILFVITSLLFIGSVEWKSINSNSPKIDMNVNTNFNLPQNQIEYIQSLVGLESKDMKILDNPLRIEGSFYIPEDTILSFVDHYLKNTNNKDIENIKITINENGLTIGGQYKLLAYLKTPIDIDILPTLTEDNDLRLNLKDIRVLNLSLNNDIVDAIADSWFSNLDNITVDKGDIIIDKTFFKNTNIKSISVEKDYLVVNLSISLK
ncbi:hypothetical protein [Terrisporobacter mayombei]|uniref:DUF2140 domain-containing protein n=1 Tax=Terrisporobacter mayombei TaxID=1541 RepID=A0ABY9PWG1_9FIRM|nr:hypothetical protein [Terrisporobacter mayombei]MCC3869850.1 hypothetical protein [Terrisporobacter mayombei]WMT79739.1 hypothetical protein TEMA_00040 [Terrisporobacter mayombei]